MAHANSCKVGHVLTRRHDALQDLVGNLAHEVTHVLRKPKIRQPEYAANGQLFRGGLEADLGLHGFEEEGGVTFIDFRVTYPDAPSHSRNLRTHLCAQEAQKRRKYFRACRLLGAGFLPAVFTTDGIAGPSAKKLLHRLAVKVAEEKGGLLAHVERRIRSQITFSILRASSSTIRSTRNRWRGASYQPRALII